MSSEVDAMVFQSLYNKVVSHGRSQIDYFDILFIPKS